MKELFGVPLKFGRCEEVIIDSAEQAGRIVGIQLDSVFGYVVYLVHFKMGAVFIERDWDEFDYYNPNSGDYDGDSAWFTPEELRKV